MEAEVDDDEKPRRNSDQELGDRLTRHLDREHPRARLNRLQPLRRHAEEVRKEGGDAVAREALSDERHNDPDGARDR